MAEKEKPIQEKGRKGQKMTDKKCKFKLKKVGKIWHGEIIKDESHNHKVTGTVKSKVVAKLRKVAKELGWAVKWK